MPFDVLYPPAGATVVRAQYAAQGRDRYANTVLEVSPGVIVVTVCDPSRHVCESRRITNESVIAFIHWHLATVADLSRRTGV
jgi:hypothetical protein